MGAHVFPRWALARSRDDDGAVHHSRMNLSRDLAGGVPLEAATSASAPPW